MRKPNGFTLLELLVVLVIVGMASSILMQALGQVYRLQGRFGVQLAQNQRGAMQADWFRQLVQGLQTDFPNGKDVFKGTPTEFSGLSTTALSIDYGAPAHFTLKLQSEDLGRVTRVIYLSGEQQLPLWAWRGEGQGRLVYVDAKGDDHEQWPPASGIWPQLPSLVRIEWQDEGAQAVVGVPRGSTEAKKAAPAALFVP